MTALLHVLLFLLGLWLLVTQPRLFLFLFVAAYAAAILYMYYSLLLVYLLCLALYPVFKRRK